MSLVHTYPQFEKKVSNWLYGEYDQTKYEVFTMLYAVPGVHDYMDYLLDKRSDQEYFDRYGMDFTDIHDPRKLRQTGSRGRVINYFSKNLDRLYKS